jgi:hypothetical protein
MFGPTGPSGSSCLPGGEGRVGRAEPPAKPERPECAPCGVDQVSGDVVYDYVAQQWSGNNGMIHFFYLENGNGTLTGASGNTWMANETWHFESQFYPPSVGQDQTLFRVHLRFISQGPLPDFELMSVFQGVISNGELRVLRLEDWPPPPSCP